jgi:hypothetical protein
VLKWGTEGRDNDANSAREGKEKRLLKRERETTAAKGIEVALSREPFAPSDRSSDRLPGREFGFVYIDATAVHLQANSPWVRRIVADCLYWPSNAERIMWAFVGLVSMLLIKSTLVYMNPVTQIVCGFVKIEQSSKFRSNVCGKIMHMTDMSLD